MLLSLLLVIINVHLATIINEVIFINSFLIIYYQLVPLTIVDIVAVIVNVVFVVVIIMLLLFFGGVNWFTVIVDYFKFCRRFRTCSVTSFYTTKNFVKYYNSFLRFLLVYCMLVNEQNTFTQWYKVIFLHPQLFKWRHFLH